MKMKFNSIAKDLSNALTNFDVVAYKQAEAIEQAKLNLLAINKSTQQTILDVLAPHMKTVKTKAQYKDFIGGVVCALTNGKCENVGQYGKEKLAGHHVLTEVNTWINKNFVNASKVDLTAEDSAKQLQETYKKKPAKKGAQNKVKASKKSVTIQPSKDEEIAQLVLRLERLKMADQKLFNATFKAMDKALATREAKLAK